MPSHFFHLNQFKYGSSTDSYVQWICSQKNGYARPRGCPTPKYTPSTSIKKDQHNTTQLSHNNNTMVSTKFLPTLSPNMPKPKLRRSIPFGSTYANVYGYEKLSNEYDMNGSMKSCDSYNSGIGSGNGTVNDVDVLADDDSITDDSVFSVLFPVGDQSISSDECSYSYSLSSDPSRARKSSRTHFKKYSEDGVTIDTSDYSNCTFDLSFMSRHAGLDYNGRIPPKPKDGTPSSIIGVNNPSRVDLPKEALSHNDEDILEGARIIKEHLRAIACHQQLEKTFDSDIDEDLSTSSSAMLLPSLSNERKGHRARKWLRRRKSMSSLMRSLTSPAA